MGVKNLLLPTVKIDRMYGPDVRAQKMTPVRAMTPYVRAVRTVVPYGLYVRVVCTGFYLNNFLSTFVAFDNMHFPDPMWYYEDCC